MRKTRRKTLICCVIIGTLTAGLLSGCKQKAVNYDVEDTQALNASKAGELTQFADVADEKWRDNIITKDENGETLNVKISADIIVPEAEQMSVVEIKEYEYSPENKKMVAEAFFGDEIYSCTNNREYLEHWIATDEEQLEYFMKDYTQQNPDDWYYQYDDENIARLNAEIPVLKEYLQTATSEFVKETDFTAERFLGKIDNIYYELYFEEAVGDKRINLEVCELFLGEEAAMDLIMNETVMDYTYQDGLEKADEILTKAGFHMASIDSGVAEQDEYSSFYVFSFSTEIVEGYQMADFELLSGNYAALKTKYEFQKEDDSEVVGSYTPELLSKLMDIYPMADEVLFIISNSGFSMQLCHPVEVVSVTPSVLLLDFEKIRDIMISEITDSWDLSYYEHTSEILLDQMELTYFRIKDVEQEGYYSFVPVWKLSRAGCNTMIIVNAIDGKVIDLKEVL